MRNNSFNLNDVRFEISFKSFEELRRILKFYQRNSLYKINIPCKNSLKKDFLLESIKISREEFPNIDIIPHFSISHEFKRNRMKTQASFYNFLHFIKNLGCKEILLISGSQKRSTLDSVSALNMLEASNFYSNNDIFIGVAFNPYLQGTMFEQEILRLEKKLESGLVRSIWFQFGSDYKLLKSRMQTIKNIISKVKYEDSKRSQIKFFGSVLIPSKQFLARFKFRPWKGVYCSDEFLESVDVANEETIKLLQTYKEYEIYPVIETNTSNENYLNNLKRLLVY